MKKLLLVVAAMFVLVGCSDGSGLAAKLGLKSSGVSSSSNVARPRCADLMAEATVSTTPVAGAYACLEPDVAASLGVTSDQDMANIAKSIGATSLRFVEKTYDGEYMYEAKTSSGASGFLLVTIDKQGKVSIIA